LKILQDIDEAQMDLRGLRNNLADLESKIEEKKEEIGGTMVNEIKFLQAEFLKLARRDMEDFSHLNTQFSILTQEKNKLGQLVAILDERVRQAEEVIGMEYTIKNEVSKK
jgi:predicted  nucleic acid-binding Zn-ribbon protein